MSGHDRFIEDQFSAATDELRSQVDQLDPGQFRPNRSAMPAVLVLAVLLGLGALGFAAFNRSTDSGSVSVATQPEAPDATNPDAPSISEPRPAEESPESPSPIQGPTDGSVRALTAAATGDYFTPIPGVSAWNANESKVLLYRSGSTSGHVVIDAANLAGGPIEIQVSPPDIEQVYWHPQQANELLYTVDATLLALDTSSGETRTVHEFAGCDRVGSGGFPVPPAADGTLSLLCVSVAQQQLMLFDLSSETERVRSEPVDLTAVDTAALPSPSGDRLVRWNEDGTASVLDRELADTGVVLELNSNRFGFITDTNGREWVLATLFAGDAIGTAVLLPLDGGDEPVVVIGPDRGDSYPPAGNQISTAGNRAIISAAGPDDGAIAGRVTVLDFADSIVDPVRTSITHRSVGRFDYWSDPFVALSPSGHSFVYSSDSGGASVDTYIVAFPDQ